MAGPTQGNKIWGPWTSVALGAGNLVYCEGPVSFGVEASIIFEIDDTSMYVSAAYVESKVYTLKIGKLLEPTLGNLAIAWDEYQAEPLNPSAAGVLTLGNGDRTPAETAVSIVGTGNTSGKTTRTIYMEKAVATDYGEYSQAKSERVGVPLTFKDNGGTVTITDS